MTNLDYEILCNRAAQGNASVDDVLREINSGTEEHQRHRLRQLAAMVQQASPSDGDAAPAIEKAGVSAKRTASVLIGKSPIVQQFAKLWSLPSGELDDVCRILLAVLAIADRRRRTEKCSGGCQHWWHGDLEDELYVQRVRREYDASLL